MRIKAAVRPRTPMADANCGGSLARAVASTMSVGLSLAQEDSRTNVRRWACRGGRCFSRLRRRRSSRPGPGSARRSKCRRSPLAPGEKLYCVSYAPFRGDQNPFGPDVPIDPRQIDEDLAQLKQITDCVRTYSTDHGLDQIAEIARRHGMKVMQGLWLSSLPDADRKQIDDRDRAGQAVSRCDRGGHRRQ